MDAVERPTQLIELARGPVEYRWEKRGPRVVLMLHGGHMRASLPLGEAVFADAGFTVLAVSRPGYGRTPLDTGRDPAGFADVIAELCDRLGIERLAAVVGQSAGGPTAVTLAARKLDLVERLILQSAVGFSPWPDRWTRVGGRCVFAARTEKVTWALIHALARRAPEHALPLLLRDLTRRPVRSVIADLSPADRTALLGLFALMRSGAGFAADLRSMVRGQAEVPSVGRPTLVIATPDDGAVPFAHARALAAAIPNARLVLSRAPSHFIWFGDDYPAIAATMTDFLG
jgi:pimeloyl-ACP methyl ester carboxylesterase